MKERRTFRSLGSARSIVLDICILLLTAFQGYAAKDKVAIVFYIVWGILILVFLLGIDVYCAFKKRKKRSIGDKTTSPL